MKGETCNETETSVVAVTERHPTSFGKQGRFRVGLISESFLFYLSLRNSANLPWPPSSILCILWITLGAALPTAGTPFL